MLEFVEFAQVLLPTLVDEMQQDHLLKLLDDALALGVVGLLEVARDIIHPASVGDWHHDTVKSVALVFIYLLNDRHSQSLYAVGLALEGCHYLLE